MCNKPGDTSQPSKCIACGGNIWEKDFREPKVCRNCMKIIDKFLRTAITDNNIGEFVNANPEGKRQIFLERLKKFADAMGKTGPFALLMMDFKGILEDFQKEKSP